MRIIFSYSCNATEPNQIIYTQRFSSKNEDEHKLFVRDWEAKWQTLRTTKDIVIYFLLLPKILHSRHPIHSGKCKIHERHIKKKRKKEQYLTSSINIVFRP